jgi:hypothetical protein
MRVNDLDLVTIAASLAVLNSCEQSITFIKTLIDFWQQVKTGC